MGRKPDFLIIGAMKSATTSLYHQLRRQSGIFMPDLKEPNYFSDAANFRRGQDWYESLFDDAHPDDLCGEASTHYTKLPTFPDTVVRLKAALPSARLIYVMRHPVDRLVSQYVHQWSEREISCGLDEAIERYPELIAYSRYAMQIAPYIETYGRDAVLPVFFENLKSEPQGELERICRFIGFGGQVRWKTDMAPGNVSSGRIRRFPLYRLLVDAPLAERLRRTLVPKTWRQAIRGRLTMGERPKLSASNLARLEEWFSADLALLAEIAGNKADAPPAGMAERYNWIRRALTYDSSPGPGAKSARIQGQGE